jgi:hypothetical protein
MDEISALWRAVWLAGPDVSAPRLVLADRLDDTGREADAQAAAVLRWCALPSGGPGLRARVVELHKGEPLRVVWETFFRVHPVNIYTLSNGWVTGVLYHRDAVNADGFRPARWRPNGKLKTWKRQPERFSLPVKHGLYSYGQVTNANAGYLSTCDPSYYLAPK